MDELNRQFQDTLDGSPLRKIVILKSCPVSKAEFDRVPLDMDARKLEELSSALGELNKAKDLDDLRRVATGVLRKFVGVDRELHDTHLNPFLDGDETDVTVTEAPLCVLTKETGELKPQFQDTLDGLPLKEVGVQDSCGVGEAGFDLVPLDRAARKLKEFSSMLGELNNAKDLDDLRRVAIVALREFLREGRELHDTHLNPFLNGHKPDITMTKSGERFSSISAQVLIVLKFKNDAGTSFGDDDKGHVLKYIRHTFLCQPWRREFVCILLSNFHAMVMAGRCNDGVVSLVEYAPKLLANDANAVYDIYNALSCDLQSIDEEFWSKILKWDPERHISTLHSSRKVTIYRYGRWIFKRLWGDSVQDERDILLKLSTTDNVVHLSAEDVIDTLYLVLPYEGETFERRRMSAEVMCGVIDTLKLIHEKGVLHRDIRPANLIFDIKNDKAIVIDFGLAVVTDEQGNLYKGRFVGTTIFSPNSHLDDYSNDELEFSPATDLESLVKAWVFMSRRMEIVVPLLDSYVEVRETVAFATRMAKLAGKSVNEAECEARTDTYKWIARDWDVIFERESGYKSVIRAARKGDYEGLKRCIAALN